MIQRRRSLEVKVGNVTVGGGSPVVVQSMTNTKTSDLEATLAQINRLAQAGAEVVRVAIPDEAAARTLALLVQQSPVPLVADIHFDYRLAIISLQAGAAEIRINPGNIGGLRRFHQVVAEAGQRGAAIRIGVNAGSLEKDLLNKYGRATPQALVESMLRYLQETEKLGYKNVICSLKASDVLTTVEAYRLIAARVSYPLHIGLTEAGPGEIGIVKSAVALGILLAEGIGDTIRVSLTAAPEEEIRIARLILQALRLREYGPELISCPTCGRCEIELLHLAGQVSELLKSVKKPLKIAVMGCAVNGPGEAREADLGVSGSRNGGYIFCKGKIVKRVGHDKLLDALKEELERLEQPQAT